MEKNRKNTGNAKVQMQDTKLVQDRIWITLVMFREEYAKAAMVMCQSARDVKTKYKIWCMVTPDISAQVVAQLKIVFDQVIQVPYIRHKTVKMKTERQRDIYESWIDMSFTKWNVLDPKIFPQIDKLFFLDADAVFLKNMDHLFEMSPPAMVFAHYQAKPWCSERYEKLGQSFSFKRCGGRPNPYMIANGKEMPHACVVDPKQIRKGFEKDSFVGNSALVLLKPNKLMFDAMLEILSPCEVYGVTECASGFDEQLISELVIYNQEKTGEPIHHIHQQYSWLTGQDHFLMNGEEPYLRQFTSTKPWREDRDKTQWLDVKEWFAIYDRVLKFIHV